MKRILTIIVAIFALVLMAKAETIEVGNFGNGAATSTSTPINFRFGSSSATYSQSESLYQAADLSALGATAEAPVEISALGYEYSCSYESAFTSGNMRLFLMNEAADTEYDGSTFTDMSEITPVWTGTMTINPGDTNFKVQLSTPFAYTGGALRVVWMADDIFSFDLPKPRWTCGYQAVSRYKDTTDPKGAVTGVTASIRLEYEATESVNPQPKDWMIGTPNTADDYGWSQINTPIDISYPTSKYEIIYQSNVIPFKGAYTINRISLPYYQSEYWHSKQGDYTTHVKVYLQNTTDTEVADTHFADVSGQMLVYDGDAVFKGGTQADYLWLDFDIPEGFKYEGRNLRITFEQQSDIYSQCYFGSDGTLARTKVVSSHTFGEGYYDDLKVFYATTPIVKFNCTSLGPVTTLLADSYAWEAGEAYIGQSYTKEIRLQGKNLISDVEVAVSKNSEVSVDKTRFSADEIKSGATLTLTLSPQNDENEHASIVISTDNTSPITYNINWTPLWPAPDGEMVLDSYSWEAGEVLMGDVLTKVVTVKADGIDQDIKVSVPNTSAVSVSPLVVTAAELQANNYVATFTVTLSPVNRDDNRDVLKFSTRGLAPIEYPITWTPSLGYVEENHQVGTINDYSQLEPLFNSWEASETEIVYSAQDLGLKKGAKIRRLAWPVIYNLVDYNAEVTVSLANTTDAEVGTDFCDEITQVAKMQRTIPLGGNLYSNTPYYWLEMELPEAFVYDGSNLRVRLKAVSDKTSDYWYFGCDGTRRVAALIRMAGDEAGLSKCSYETDNLRRTIAYYPVVKITAADETTMDARINLASYSWLQDEAVIGKTYTKEIKLTATGATGDIVLSTPNNSAVTVSPSKISEAEAQAGAVITVTLAPTNLEDAYASFMISPATADAIEFPVFWKASQTEPYDDLITGNLNNWSQYAPFSFNYHNSKNEFVITADQLGFEGRPRSIKRLAFPYYQYTLYGDPKAFTAAVKLSLENTDEDNVGSSFTNEGRLTTVFEGDVTLFGGDKTNYKWLILDFPKEFVYTGKNLRIVGEHSADTHADFFFGDDVDRKTNEGNQARVLLADNPEADGTVYDSNELNIKRAPVVKVYTSNHPVMALDDDYYDCGEALLGEAYSKEITLYGVNLTNDVVISAPKTSAVSLSCGAETLVGGSGKTMTLSKEAACDGTSLKITINPENLSSSRDRISITSEDVDDVLVYTISWSPVDGIITIQAEGTASEIYDLQGRRTSSSQRGIFILDGKKVHK